MVWYGMVWYGMVWYGMVWHGMVQVLGLLASLLAGGTSQVALENFLVRGTRHQTNHKGLNGCVFPVHFFLQEIVQFCYTKAVYRISMSYYNWNCPKSLWWWWWWWWCVNLFQCLAYLQAEQHSKPLYIIGFMFYLLCP